MRACFSLLLPIFALSGCGGSGGYAEYVPPPPVVRENSNLHIFGVNGTRELLFLRSLSAAVMEDGTGLSAHVPQNLSFSSRLYAGEISTNGRVCDIFGCYTLPEDQRDWVVDKLYFYVMGPERITSTYDPMRDSILVIVEAHSANGGVSETFQVPLAHYNYGDIGTFEAELFNMDGPSGNGFKEATMVVVQGTALDGTRYGWASAIGTEPWIDPNRSGSVFYTGQMRGTYIFEGGGVSDATGDAYLVFDFDSPSLSGTIANAGVGDITLAPSSVSPDNPAVFIGSASADWNGTPGYFLDGGYVASVFGGGSEIGGAFAMTGQAGPSGVALSGAFVAAE